MAELEQAVYTRLTGYAGLTALIGARVYPIVLPQNPTYPAVTYQRIGGERWQMMTADSGIAAPVLQLDCYGATYASVKAVATQLRGALERWVSATADPEVLDVMLETELDHYDEGVQKYRVQIDYRFYHRET